MSHDRPFGPRLAPPTSPLLEEQVVALNRALTAEVLRHAETREKLLTVLTFCWLKEHLEPVAVIRPAPVAVAPVKKTASSIQAKAAQRMQTAGFLHACVDLAPGVIFDPDAWRLVRATGAVVKISGNEGALLRALIAEHGQTVLYTDLAGAVWQEDMSPDRAMHSLRVLSARLRARLRAVGVVGLLTTVRWVGLRLEVAS